MSSGIEFRQIEERHLIKAPEAIGKGEEKSKEGREDQDFDCKNFKKIDRKIMTWMLLHNPLVFFKTLLQYSQNEELLMEVVGLHEILSYALMKSALTGVVQKVLQTKGLFSKNDRERKEALVHLLLTLPRIKKSIKKTQNFSITPNGSGKCATAISTLLSSHKNPTIPF